MFLANATLAAVGRLGLTPETSLPAAAGIFLGGMVNISVRKIPRDDPVERPMIPQRLERRG